MGGRGKGMGGTPHHTIFFETPYQNLPLPHYKLSPPPPLQPEKQNPHWKVKLSSTKWFLEKYLEKLENNNNNFKSTLTSLKNLSEEVHF